MQDSSSSNYIINSMSRIMKCLAPLIMFLFAPDIIRLPPRFFLKYTRASDGI